MALGIHNHLGTWRPKASRPDQRWDHSGSLATARLYLECPAHIPTPAPPPGPDSLCSSASKARCAALDEARSFCAELLERTFGGMGAGDARENELEVGEGG